MSSRRRPARGTAPEAARESVSLAARPENEGEGQGGERSVPSLSLHCETWWPTWHDEFDPLRGTWYCWYDWFRLVNACGVVLRSDLT